MANVDKKSDPAQIIQAVLDVSNQAIKTVIAGGQTSIAISHLDGDSIYSYLPSKLLESLEIDFNVLDKAEIVLPTSIIGLEKFQLYLETTGAITATTLSCQVEVSPVDAGNIWVQIITTAVPAALGTAVSAVVSSLARRVRVIVTVDAFTVGKFVAHLIGS